MNSAWECPRCKRINAPFSHMCICKPETANELDAITKMFNDPRAQQQFNPAHVAYCLQCGKIVNELICHICYMEEKK